MEKVSIKIVKPEAKTMPEVLDINLLEFSKKLDKAIEKSLACGDTKVVQVIQKLVHEGVTIEELVLLAVPRIMDAFKAKKKGMSLIYKE